MKKLIATTDTVHDYNGTGQWSADAIQKRYRDYAARFPMAELADLSPRETAHGTHRWIYPVMERIIEAIEQGDAAAVQIGVEFIGEDQTFPFGKSLKAKTARVLRRASLTPDQKETVRRRVLQMLMDGHIPQEYGDYAKLLRQIGIGPEWSEVEAKVDRNNPYVMRYFYYFRQYALAPSINAS